MERLCKDPQCRRLIYYSENDRCYKNADDNKFHSLSCSWTPKHNSDRLSELILVSSKDFNEAIENINQQFKSTQQQLVKTNALAIEIAAKLDAYIRSY